MNIFEEIALVEKMKQDVTELEKRIKQKQMNCNHLVRTAPVYDPEIVKESSDPILENLLFPIRKYETYFDREIPRWSQLCTQCGLRFYTFKTKAIKSVPDFS